MQDRIGRSRQETKRAAALRSEVLARVERTSGVVRAAIACAGRLGGFLLTSSRLFP